LGEGGDGEEMERGRRPGKGVANRRGKRERGNGKREKEREGIRKGNEVILLLPSRSTDAYTALIT